MSGKAAVLNAPTGDDARIYVDRGQETSGLRLRRDERQWYTAFCPTGEDARVWRQISSTAAHQRLLHFTYFVDSLNVRATITPAVRQSSRPKSSTAREATPTPAARLRELAGLGAGRLATVLGVSRTAYNNWIRSGTPQGPHGEQLLEIVSLVEEAAKRLGTPNATREWLLTPTSPGGKKPIELLGDRQYTTFRGYLLRVPTGREIVRRLSPPAHSLAPITEDARREGLALLRPRLWREDQLDDTEAAQAGNTPDGTGAK
jgi:hypothetical protein